MNPGSRTTVSAVLECPKLGVSLVAASAEKNLFTRALRFPSSHGS